MQECKPHDSSHRFQFVKQVTERFPIFNTLFSNEAHLHLNGHLNKQNYRYRSATIPTSKHRKPLHSPELTIWETMSAPKIMGSAFLKTVTVKLVRYVKMLNYFLVTELYNILHKPNISLPLARESFFGK